MDTELPSSSSSSLTADSSQAAQAGKEKPIFTLKQMTLIAERMCKVKYVLSLKMQALDADWLFS